ncbi:hypothetical protein FSP39_009386 [Pinctada imbricata]|uniref:Proline dehydrogenase n=1 Tax=Pinctada imbricata TaxID=66713 RepID=A0AA88XF68_PINIB|nr:hypothetical protein FSP39_009386 [Pinctada imbricata]
MEAKSKTSSSNVKLDMSFTDHVTAYASKSTPDLLRAIIIYQLFSVDFIVNNNQKILKWTRKLLGKSLFCTLMRGTFYGHFVAGQDQDDIRPLVTRNRMFGVKSILDYSVEEDLSTKEAKEAEMKYDPDIQRFLPHEEFGDRREGVVSARTYFYEDEAKCDENTETFIKCIDAVAGATTDNTGFVAIKMTALGRPQFLLQLSDVLVSYRKFFEKFAGNKGRFTEEDFKRTLKQMGLEIERDDRKRWFSLLDFNKDGEVDLIDWDSLRDQNMSMTKKFLVPNEITGELVPVCSSLAEEEEKQLKNMLKRLQKLAEHADKRGVRVMIDAEQTYFQPAISSITLEMMKKFNKGHCVIFNTYQCYLKSALDSVVNDLELSRREDFYFGCKLVRGAYMEQERERARMIGYEDPVNPSYEATSDMYHSTLEQIMKEINVRPRGEASVMVASHNEETVRITVQHMKKYNIGPGDRLVCFGQLLGMCDQVSFPLGQAGYSVYKYVPYGPVEEVLPYLSRRALENRGVLAKVKKEKMLLRKELKRRIKEGDLRHDPLKVVPA